MPYLLENGGAAMMVYWRMFLISVLFVMFLSVFFLSPSIVYAKDFPPMPPAPGEPINGKINFYEPDWLTDFNIVDDTGEKRQFKVRGERWQYQTKLGQGQVAQKDAILAWLQENGCELLARGPNRIMARNQDHSVNKLTYCFEMTNDFTRVWVYLERLLTPTNTVTMTIGGGERKRFDLWMDHDGRHYASLVDVSLVELDENILPEADRMNCYEGGAAGKIISVEPLKTPLHVVVLLDSSGSMKGAMKQALAAVKTFVSLFPENAEITIVDFDTKPKKLPTGDRSALLKAIDGVKANGATCLYDSILLGINELTGKDRRALVVFTDGVDANYNDTGPGSKATKTEVMEAVEAGKTPVYTIGFGKNRMWIP